ncbi:MAG TPA: LCP family protein [Acidimicrobiia bacterium]|nr:LCP family protein [Acidimicrobiia bacterium]
MRRRAVVFMLLGPLLSGMLLATLVSAAWMLVGLPLPAKADTWFRVAQVPPTGQASYTSGSPDQVQFFLVVGNDSYNRGDRGGIGLGDAIHVIGVNPGAHAATIIDIPRDTSLGAGKINATLEQGGLAAMTSTVSGFVGVPIRFAMTTNFDDFINMVDEMGGIDLNIQQPMHDLENSGSDFEPGPQHVVGADALKFARDRHSFSEGDLRRTQNQGYLMIAALQTIQARNPGASGMLNLLATLGRHVVMENVSLTDLYRLGRLALTIDPNNIKNVVIPTGGGSGTNLSPGAGIDDLFADFRDDGILESH